MNVGTVRVFRMFQHGSGRLRRLGLLLTLIGGGVMPGAGSFEARAQELLESTRPVLSPDARHSVTVEWAVPVATGDGVDFSGRMQVRVRDVGGTATRQRLIEAPQVRSVQTPQWLDNRWAAFTYNIQKNFNGMVFLDAASGSALQLEMIAPVRRMGGTGRMEAELTSLDVIEHDTTGSVLYRNITRGRSSVFPLVLSALPPFEGRPFSRAFLQELRGAVAAYRNWLDRQGAEDLHLEAGTETFSPDENHVAMLTCVRHVSQPETSGPATALLITPLKARGADEALASTRLVPLDSSVQLACASGSYDPDTVTLADYIRYTTRWTDARTVAVEREVNDEEQEEIITEPVFLVSLDGETTRLPAADSVPVAVSALVERDSGEDEKEEDAKEKKSASERARSRDSRPAARRTPAPASASSARSARDSRPRIPAVSAPAGTPAPVRPATPTPYIAEPIPNLLNRFSFPWGGSESESAPASRTQGAR